MRVLGRTMTGKVVVSNDGFSDLSLDIFYKDFSINDHYDALAIWCYYHLLDDENDGRYTRYHASKANIQLFDSRKLYSHGRELAYARLQTAKSR